MERSWILEIRLCSFIEVDTDEGFYVHKPLFSIVYGRLGRWSEMEVLILNGTLLNSWDYIIFVYRGGHWWRFILSQTSFFHSLRSFREVVVNRGINLEWNALEFLWLDHVRLQRWTLMDFYIFIISSHLGKWSFLEV